MSTKTSGTAASRRPAKRRDGATADPRPDVRAVFEAGTPIDEALREAFVAAARRHRRDGVPMVFWRDGQVVEVPAEEVLAGLGLDA